MVIQLKVDSLQIQHDLVGSNRRLFLKKMQSKNNYLDAQENSSGSTTPIFSWTPLPQRRKLTFVENKNQDFKQNHDAQDPLYPNCDVNIWLRSCEEEVKTPIKGKITGVVPKWLDGCLIRNGPGSLKVGNEEFSHLFDSSGLLHRFSIKNGKVTYQSRFLQSEAYKKNWAANRIVASEFGTKTVKDPCHSIFRRVAAIFQNECSDNSMISVYPFGDELYAFGETPIIHKINNETLETEERVNIGNYISIVHHTSHPHIVNDGTVFNLGMSAQATGLSHIIVKFPKVERGSSKEMFEKAHIVASLSTRWTLHPSYMHTFGITENFFIIVEQPLSISIPGMIGSRFNNEPLAACFRWYHEEYTRISVISRKTGKLHKHFFAESFFYLHIINQYESENHVVLDICIYKDPSMLDCMNIETMKGMQQNPDYAKMFRSRPARFVLPLNPDKKTSVNKNLVKLKNTKAKAHFTTDGNILVKPEKICDLGCETPRINYENNLGKLYKYFYAISADVDNENPGTLIKVDIQTRNTKTWGEKNCYPSEPIFVPTPEAQSEDDGIVLSALIWGEHDTNRVGLLVLDAESFTELARIEFQTPGPVPKCLHGWFLSTTSHN